MLAAHKRIDRHEWYRQGAGAKLFYLSYPWSTCVAMKICDESIRPRYDMMAYYHEAQIEFYFTTESLRAVAQEYFGRVPHHPDFLRDLMDHWQRVCVQPFRKFLEQWERGRLYALSDTELTSVYHEFRHLYIKVWEQAIFLDSFDYESDFLLPDLLKKEGKDIAATDLDLLLSPPAVSFLQKERLELLALAEQIHADAKQAEFVASHADFADFFSQYAETAHALEKHGQMYHWILNDYALVRRLNAEYFYGELRHILCKPEKFVQEKEMRDSLSGLARKKQEIIEQCHLSQDFVHAADFLARLGNFRDARKSYNQLGNAFLRSCVEEWSRRYGFPVETLEDLFFFEVEMLLTKSQLLPEFSRLAQQRNQGVFFLESEVPDVPTFFGSEARELQERVFAVLGKGQELRGRTAYPGTVRGTVRIIRNQSDFAKMKQGDILVAPNTRPEYVPIMKLAAAIISDEGGLTCHSAIVSRELKIPCIVGVQTATIMLKDRDQVEVDATRGTVRKL